VPPCRLRRRLKCADPDAPTGVPVGDLCHPCSPLALSYAVVAAVRWQREVGEGANLATRRALGAADGRREQQWEDPAISGAGVVSAGDLAGPEGGAVGDAMMGICFLLGRPPLKFRCEGVIFAPRSHIYSSLIGLGFRIESAPAASGAVFVL
jgi:hypothetical protein